MTPTSDTPAFENPPLQAYHAPDSSAEDFKARVYTLDARIAYWWPVIAVVVLFAQVSFLGLRPALSEARRLAAAEEVLTARHAVAMAQNQALTVQLAARTDPVFRERQRRLGVITPAPAAVPGAKPAATTDQ